MFSEPESYLSKLKETRNTTNSPFQNNSKDEAVDDSRDVASCAVHSGSFLLTTVHTGKSHLNQRPEWSFSRAFSYRELFTILL